MSRLIARLRVALASSVFLALLSAVIAQPFTATYDFAGVLANAGGLTDPTAVPTASGVTFGSFAAVGTPANPNAGGRFSFTAWPLGGVNGNDTYSAHTGVLSAGQYYQVTITPQAGYALNLTALTFTIQRSATGIRTYAVRSNAGGNAFATNLPASISPANAVLSVPADNVFYYAQDALATAQNGSTVTLTDAAFQNITSAVTFRFYGWNAEASGGTFSIDNVVFTGNAVAVGGPVAPSITTSPSSQAVTEGAASVQFHVVASGDAPLAYQWRKGGSNLSNDAHFSGVLTDTLTINNVVLGDTGSYDVVVSNAAPTTATSSAATLTVNPAIIPPGITTHPTPQAAALGGSATFNVVASGTAPLSYQWRRGGSPLSNGGNISGATSASLTINPVSAADVASYDVVVSNAAPTSATSNSAALSLGAVVTPAGLVSYTGGAYLQNFDTLPASGTFTLTSSGPLAFTAAPISASGLGGWTMARYAGSGSVALFRAETGSGTSGSIYSFGALNAPERALGSLSSGSTVSRFGLTLTNSTGLPITQFTLSYRGEQWRRGSANVNKLTFEYALGAGDINTGTFVAAPTLDFSSVAAAGTTLNGNDPINQAAISATVTGFTWAPGQTLTLRWTDVDDSGSDDGLAIDDLNFSTLVNTGDILPSVVYTTPAAGTVNIPLNSSFSVTFNEAVNFSAASVALNGNLSGAHVVTVSGGPTTFTVTPDTTFGEIEDVALTVLAGQVTDASTGTKHPGADYTANFITTSSGPLPIHVVQGSGSTSAYKGYEVIVQGIVTASFQVGGINGYYIEAPDAQHDANPATSEGIYVFDNVNTVAVGNLVTITGTVDEFGTAPNSQTEIKNVTAFTVNSPSVALPTPVAVSLPFPSDGYAERYEGMLVTFPQSLTVNDNFDYGIFGEVSLSNGRLPTPTNVAAPGAPAQAQMALNKLNQILLDDGVNTQYPSPTPFLIGATPETQTLRAGSTTAGVTGILDNKFGAYVLEPTVTPTFTDSNPRLNSPASLGSLRVVIGNVENFMNGDGLGGGFPTSRGATSFAEYQRQLAKVTAAILNLAPDIMGITEMENDKITNSEANSFGPNSAVAQLVANLNANAPAGTTYGFVNASAVDIVTDVIHCVFIYRKETVEEAGVVAMLSHPAFNNLARNPLAQTFREKATGAKLTVTINHFRAKASVASGAGNADSGDGQGNNNALRLQEAQALTAWLATHPTGDNDADVLIIGDLNAYAKEDPITHIVNAGYINLSEHYEGEGGYSYAFGGEFGHLDHALSTPSLTTQVLSTATWHANSDEPVYYDYNVEDKNAAQQAINVGTPYRYADHDPVVVGMSLTAAPTITTQPVSQTTTVGTGVTFTAAAIGYPAPSFQWRKGGNPIDGATSPSYTIASPLVADGGTYDVVISNSVGSVTSDPATLTVNPATATVTLGDLAQIYNGAPRTVSVSTTPAGLAVNVTYDGNPVALANAGSYAVVAAVNDVNYIGYANGTLVVSPAPATVSLGGLSHTYDGSGKSATVTTSPVGVATTVTYNGGASLPINAGSYAVAAAIADTNYVGAPANDTLTIAQAAATVSLGNLSQVFDNSPKSVTVSTNPAGLVVDVTYNGSAAAPTNVGTYAVVATVNEPNYTGTTSGTLAITAFASTITLDNLVQAYDGTPKSVTVTTTPAGLAVNVTYNGSATAPTLPGAYAVVATITDANYAGTASDTLFITTAALVRHAPTFNGIVDGSVQVLLAESATFNSSAQVTGDLLMIGKPTVKLNGSPVYSGTIDGTGAATPTNHTVTLNSGAKLRHVVRRVDAIAMPTVSAPPAPTGTRNVTLNSAGQSPGDFATLRNLTLNSNAGAVTVPAGTYGAFAANGTSSFVLGVTGATTPSVYNLQSLNLNSSSRITIVGPVIINLASGVTLNGSVGAPGQPEWLELNVASGGVTLNGTVKLDAYVLAPNGTVTINGGTVLTGEIICDRLTLNSGGILVQP